MSIQADESGDAYRISKEKYSNPRVKSGLGSPYALQLRRRYRGPVAP